MGLFRRKQRKEQEQLATDAKSTQQAVIDYVSGLDDEEYKKLLKKFTAYRELVKRIAEIEDGDINAAADNAKGGMDFEELQPSTPPQPKRIEITTPEDTLSVRKDKDNGATKYPSQSN